MAENGNGASARCRAAIASRLTGLLFAALLLSACATKEPPPDRSFANWLTAGARDIRITDELPDTVPLYAVEKSTRAGGTARGAGVGALLGLLLVKDVDPDCSGSCAVGSVILVAGSTLVGGIVGFFVADTATVSSFPVDESTMTRPLRPVLSDAGQDITRRAAGGLAENLRRRGRHAVSKTDTADGEESPGGAVITVSLSKVEFVGAGPGKSSRGSMRVQLHVAARWRGSLHSQVFTARSGVAEIDLWTDPDGETLRRAVDRATAKLADKMFAALAEP